MAKTNRECYACGQSYYHCPTCPSETKKETFYNMFCCERCSKIFKTLTDETFKRITTAQCKEQLLQMNVSSNETFRDGINKHIAKVFSYKEPIVEIIETVEEVIPEVEIESKQEIEETVIEETIIEEVEEKKMKDIPKKNRNRQNSEVD